MKPNLGTFTSCAALVLSAIVVCCGGATAGISSSIDGGGASQDGGNGIDASLPPVTCTFGADPSVAGVCADVACVACQQSARCDPFRFQTTYVSVDACIARYVADCKVTAAAKGTTTPLSAYEACAKDTAPLGCDDILTRTLPASCALTPGTIPEGSGCTTSAQCATAYCAFGTANAACGVCKIQAIGLACAYSGADCGPGLVCSAGGMCAAYAKAGEPCSFPTDCVPTLTCIANKCATPLQTGAPCDPASDACDARLGLACDATAKTCTPDQIVTSGCEDYSVGVRTMCPAGAYCSIDDSPPGSCLPVVADGASCVSSNPETTTPECMPFAVCDATLHTCGIPDPAACP